MLSPDKASNHERTPLVQSFLNKLSLIAGGLFLLLTGCQSTTGNPALQTLQAAIWGAEAPLSSALNPAFQYLRVTIGRNVAFIALGYVEPHPQGAVEVWYSSKREALRLQNGRLAGVAGTVTEWRQVRMPELPAWRDLARLGKPYVWTRMRDVMPGYRYNVADRLQLTVIGPPAGSALVGIAPATLTWFEESRLQSPDAGDALNHLPPARYAVEFTGNVGGRVVYAEQCISTELCITWQRWQAGQ